MSRTTPPRGRPASVIAAAYAGWSSPNFVSQVAARQAKNARVSVRYQAPPAASRAATRRITGQSGSCRSMTMSARSSPRSPFLPLAVAVAGRAVGTAPAAGGGPQPDHDVPGPGVAPPPAAAARSTPPEPPRRREIRPGRASASRTQGRPPSARAVARRAASRPAPCRRRRQAPTRSWRKQRDDAVEQLTPSSAARGGQPGRGRRR